MLTQLLTMSTTHKFPSQEDVSYLGELVLQGVEALSQQVGLLTHGRRLLAAPRGLRWKL